MEARDLPKEHPSCTTEEAPMCEHFGIKCWMCSCEGSLLWRPKDGKTRHHTYWDRQKQKKEEKRAAGLGKMGGRGKKTKASKNVLAEAAEKRIQKKLNHTFGKERFQEMFAETVSSGRVRNDGDITSYCSLVDVKSTTRTTSWVTEKSQLDKARAQAHAHRKPYAIIINENSALESVAVMAVEDLTHLFQYVAHLESELASR